MSDEKSPPTVTADDWHRRYEERNTPWDSGLVDRELRAVVEWGRVAPCTAIELGCGTGTNSAYLAGRGFDLTAVDFAANAVAAAEAKARAAGVSAKFVCGDVTKLDGVTGPFDFVFDRGCYHSIRRVGGLGGFIKTVERLTRSGSTILILAGNPDANEPFGPPKVTAVELCGDFERLFRIESLKAMRFEDTGNVDGPLGWSLLAVRR